MPPTALTGSIATLPPAATRERAAVLRGAERRRSGRCRGAPDVALGAISDAASASDAWPGGVAASAAGAPISRPPRGRV